MKRRIIKQGHSTMTITLPSDWIKKFNLQPGDEIDVSEQHNELYIATEGNNQEKKGVIDIRDFTVPLLWRYFQSAYRAGCDEIKVVFDSSKKEYEDAFHYYTTSFEYSKIGEKVPTKTSLGLLQSITDRFLGMAIIKTGKDFCIIREMGEVTAKEFENSLRRIFLVILELFDRVIDAIKENEIGDSHLCKELHTIDLNVDKLVDYCSRIMNKVKGSFPDNKKNLLFSSLFILELLSDEFKYIGKHLATTKKSSKLILDFAEAVKEHFEIYYKLFYKFDRELSIEFGKNDLKVYSQHVELKKKLSEEHISIAKHLMMISKFTLALFELRVQMEYADIK